MRYTALIVVLMASVYLTMYESLDVAFIAIAVVVPYFDVLEVAG